jgi:hypothetical protein
MCKIIYEILIEVETTGGAIGGQLGMTPFKSIKVNRGILKQNTEK